MSIAQICLRPARIATRCGHCVSDGRTAAWPFRKCVAERLQLVGCQIVAGRYLVTRVIEGSITTWRATVY